MDTRLQAGPLLAEVLAAEERADQALSYPRLVGYADSVIGIAQRLRRPILMPVGADGQRLLGAVQVRCEGGLEQMGWRTSISGRDVLLVGVAGVSGAEILAAAAAARRLGARQVHACSVDPAMSCKQAVDSFSSLSARIHRPKRRRTA